MKVNYTAIADAVLDGETYEQAFERLSALTETVDKDIQTADIKKYLILSDKWLGIKTSNEVAAIVTMDALDIFESFNLTDPVTGAAVKAKLESMMDALIGASLIDANDKTAIMGLGEDSKPVWPELHGDPEKKIGIVVSAMDKRALGEI